MDFGPVGMCVGRGGIVPTEVGHGHDARSDLNQEDFKVEKSSKRRTQTNLRDRGDETREEMERERIR